MQQSVQKSRTTILPRRSLSVRGPPVLSQATPPSSSGTFTWFSTGSRGGGSLGDDAVFLSWAFADGPVGSWATSTPTATLRATPTRTGNQPHRAGAVLLAGGLSGRFTRFLPSRGSRDGSTEANRAMAKSRL